MVYVYGFGNKSKGWVLGDNKTKSFFSVMSKKEAKAVERANKGYKRYRVSV
jgi:hypothetical protein